MDFYEEHYPASGLSAAASGAGGGDQVKFLEKLFRKIKFPCPGCASDDAPAGGRGFCPQCTALLKLYPDDMQFCPGCGGPLDGALAVCSQCLAEPVRLWQSATAVFPYRGFGKQLIREFKFSNRPELARPLGVLAARAVQRSNWQPEILVPVPLHRWGFLLRGYNQAELLAQIVGEELGVPVANVLRRHGKRAKQAKLGRKDRHKSLSGVFSCLAPEKLQGHRVMLIDDVFTTGATLSAVAKMLNKCGVSELAVLTVARTPGYSSLEQ